MSTDKSLLEEMLSDENLNNAYLQVKRNKGASGVDGMEVIELKEKLKQLTLRSWSVNMDYRLLKIKQLVTGRINYYRLGNFKRTCQEIDRNIRLRLRMCMWKQWKKTKTRHKSLVKLEIEYHKAQSWVNSRKGYARCASSFLQVAISNEVLKTKGLVSLLDQYQLKHI